MNPIRILFNILMIAVLTVALHFIFPHMDLIVLWVLSTLGLAALSLILHK